MKDADVAKLINVDENGNVTNSIDDILKAIAIVKKREKAEGAKRRVESERRKRFSVLPIAGKLSYEQMTAFVWEFATSDMDMLRNWLSYNHPEIVVRCDNEIVERDC